MCKCVHIVNEFLHLTTSFIPLKLSRGCIYVLLCDSTYRNCSLRHTRIHIRIIIIIIIIIIITINIIIIVIIIIIIIIII
ncbi:hypothetical protein TSAR_005226 [Trichomalopsis sarcophagae]|uniref:Uncharacterized protein n=1 Tax=Trichomalopsis sarcophagae TaxID=543379 RepID=A0A232EP36_9HYME|nr:hypothetical protein TSAR_005226 [Trichomalopsis sarcophagae]